MGGGGHDVTVLKRLRQLLSRHQAAAHPSTASSPRRYIATLMTSYLTTVCDKLYHMNPATLHFCQGVADISQYFSVALWRNGATGASGHAEGGVDKAGDRGRCSPVVGHVAHEQRANLPGDVIQTLVVPLARVRGPTADQHLRPEVKRLLLQLVIVNVSRLQRPATISVSNCKMLLSDSISLP